MCSICGFTFCPSGCPNAPEPKSTYECANCGEGIYYDDVCYGYDGEIFCEDCAERDLAGILLKRGAEKKPVKGKARRKKCACCENELPEGGDEYYEYNGKAYCACCVDEDCYAAETFEALGADRFRADVPEEDDGDPSWYDDDQDDYDYDEPDWDDPYI